jgi:hypothetical protein
MSQAITVKVDELLHKLKDNKAVHNDTYRKAWDGFQKEATERLATLLSQAREAKRGDEVRLLVSLEPPSNHSEDYEQAIEMLEWHQRAGNTTIELTAADFRGFVQDKWNWSEHWASNTQSYTG